MKNILLSAFLLFSIQANATSHSARNAEQVFEALWNLNAISVSTTGVDAEVRSPSGDVSQIALKELHCKRRVTVEYCVAKTADDKLATVDSNSGSSVENLISLQMLLKLWDALENEGITPLNGLDSDETPATRISLKNLNCMRAVSPIHASGQSEYFYACSFQVGHNN